MARQGNFLTRSFDAHERRLVFQAAVVGIVVWAIVFALKTAVHEVGHEVLHFLEELSVGVLIPTLLGVLALGALIVAALARFGSSVVHYRDGEGHIHELIDVEGDGLERAISLYYASEPTLEQALMGEEGVDVRWKMPTFSLAARKFVATLATLGSGGSGGLEASVTLIGESVSAGMFKPRARLANGGKAVGRAWRWWEATDPDDLQTAQLCGISAAVSTLLGAPFAAAFFATEVMYRRRPIVEKLIYSLIAALVAFFLNNIAVTAMSGEGFSRFQIETLFDVEQRIVPPLGDWRYYVILLAMALSISLMSFLFGRLRSWADDFFHYRFTNIWVRHLTGATITGVIALLVLGGVTLAAQNEWLGVTEDGAKHALELVLGPGEGPIDAALNGELLLTIAVIALVAKMIATLATIGSGGSAGLLIPSIFFGTMIATIFSQAFAVGSSWHFPGQLLVVPAMTASLVAIVNVPMAAILFVVEVFGAPYMVPALVVLVVATIFTQRTSIYRTQREQFDQRQILPGYSIHRVVVPYEWDAKTLAELEIRSRFGLNVIGWVEKESEDGLPHVRLSADAERPLNAQDILVVVGKDEDLLAFEEEIGAN